MTIKTLDDFAEISRWQVFTSGQAELGLHSDSAPEGSAMRLDFDFKGGSGFVVARRSIDLTLPQTYRFLLAVRGAMPPNAFELKLVDPGGASVWRYRTDTFEPGADWHIIEIPSREIFFAWGPAGGGTAHEVGAIEVAVVAGSGGRGNLWISDLRLEDRTSIWPPCLEASHALPGHEPAYVADGRTDTDWCAGAGSGEAFLTMDLHRESEYGGLILRWAEPATERSFRVQASADGDSWLTLGRARRALGRCNFVGLPNGSSRYLRLAVDPGADGRYPPLVSLELRPTDFSLSPSEFFHQVAQSGARGRYPRWLYREQTYWTAVDVPDGGVPALLNEDGLIEVVRAGWVLEPFMYVDGALLGWAELAPTQRLEQGELPIPSSTGSHAALQLTTTAFAGRTAGRRLLYARYRVESRRDVEVCVRLFVAVRPFQISPPWQGFEDIGGVSPIHRLSYCDGVVVVNGNESVIPTRPPAGFGAAAFEQGPITDYLATGDLPGTGELIDELGYADGALRFDLTLPPHGNEEVVLVIPFERDRADGDPAEHFIPREATAVFAEAVREWTERLGAVRFELPPSGRELAATAKTALAHVLINRDGPALQPGPRRYTRSWIRDGAVMSAALLRLGCPTEAAEFIRWYAGFQTKDGQVPCCVDRNGPDWLVENDSPGELIFAVAEPVRFTADRRLAADLWPAVCRAVGHLEELRGLRLTEDYLVPERLACFGLLPESVSHEGYLAQPVHAYWDDLWALRGLKDAAWLAGFLGEDAEQARLTRLCEDFRTTLFASIERTMSERGRDFIPGSVEWADADPTAVAIALTLVDEAHNLPEAALRRTFDGVSKRFQAMHEHASEWTNYSPYDVRVVGAFLRLGLRREAHQVLRILLKDLRPPAWHQWPEIVWRDPRMPGHQGDLPHAWISAEYILVFRDLFAYEREADESLVVCAGIPREWLLEGPVVAIGLPTWYGRLDLRLAIGADGALELSVAGLDRVPPGGIRFAVPMEFPMRSVSINGAAAVELASHEVGIRVVPARVLVA
jgi:hypothetical protein